VFAEDRDIGLNGEVKYEITVGNNDGLFTLGETSGILIVNGNIDRETVTSFRYDIYIFPRVCTLSSDKEIRQFH
jgi:hypothetical protein